MYGKALSVLSWVVQDRRATMGKYIVILVSVCNAQYSSVVRKLLQSLASDEFKHLAYNKVIPQVKRASQWLNCIKDTNQQVIPNWSRVYSGHFLATGI